MEKNVLEITDEDVSEGDFTPEELSDESADWKAKAESLKGLNKRRAGKLGKAKETIAVLQKELESLKKPEPQNKNKDELNLLKKVSLKMAGITDLEEVELMESLQERLKMDWDVFVEDDYVKEKLSKFRDTKANAKATSDIKGSGGSQADAVNTPEYWHAKGSVDGLTEKVSDPKIRAKIMRSFMQKEAEGGGHFYNS